MQRHVVVFDCNVYLDVARLIGEPFTRESFDRYAAKLTAVSVPSSDPRHDSLRAIAACTLGRLAGSDTLEVWTSDHINRMVRNKAMHSTVTDPKLGSSGLGWAQMHAEALVSDLVYWIVDSSGGDSIGQNVPDGEPPLDHEDGLVYGACREIARSEALCKVYCVTNDKQFLRDYQAKRLRDHTTVLAPARFLALVRAARASSAQRGMMRPR